MNFRLIATWATLTAIAGTTFMVSTEAATSPLRGIGLVIPKYPALAVGSMLCALACGASWWQRRLSTTAFDFTVLGYAVVCFLSVIANNSPLPFLLPWLALNLSAFAVLAAACEGARQRRELLIDGLIAIATVVAAIAVFESVGGSLPWDMPRRPGATFANRNAVGGFCAIVIPLALIRTISRPNHWRALSITLLLLTILLCRARSSWMGLLLAAVFAIGVWILLRRQRPPLAIPMRGLKVSIAAIVTAIVTLNIVPWNGLAWVESTPMLSSFSRMLEYESGTGQSRVEQHRVGLAMLAEKPVLGFGPGSWRREAPRFAHAATNQHVKFIDPLWTPASDLLRQTVETGLPGILASAAMVISLLAGVRSRITGSRDPLTVAMASSLIVAIIISAFDALLYRPQSVALVAAVAGALRSECNHRARQVPGWIGSTAIILAAALCLTVFVPRYLATMALSRNLSAETVVALGNSRFLPYEALRAVVASGRKNDCSALIPAATLVDAYLPNEPENLRVLARCAEQQERWRDEEALLERMLRIEPHDVDTVLKLKEVRSHR